MFFRDHGLISLAFGLTANDTLNIRKIIEKWLRRVDDFRFSMVDFRFYSTRMTRIGRIGADIKSLIEPNQRESAL
jgi:hypothetical protein